jgi:hypothetical protein
MKTEGYLFFPIVMFTEQAGKFGFSLGPPWVLMSVRWRDGMNGKDLALNFME